MFFEFGAAGAVGGEDYAALEGDQDLGLAGRVEIWKVEALDLLLIHEDYLHAFLELVDYAHLEVAVEGNEGLAVAAPGWMHVDY